MNRTLSLPEISRHEHVLRWSVLALLGFAAACGAADAPQGAGSVMYVPPAAPPMTGLEAHPEPQWPAAAGASATPPSAATPQSSAPAPADTPPAALPPANTPPAAMPPANTPPAATPPSGGTPATTGTAPPAANGFNAGSGMLDADGKTVIFRIPDGTGGKDWNPSSKPIRVARGMTLRLIDDDKSTRSGGHWLHTNGQPCPHGLRAIGSGFDCVISRNAPLGVISGMFEHNVANGIGRLYVEVVADGPTVAR